MSYPKTWYLGKIWDSAFDKAPEPIKEREYLYASEVGSSFIEVFYKMRGVQPSNYPTSVARMKMEAGKVWEGIVRMVYDRAGMLKASQDKIDFSLPSLLSVHGRLDFLVGGIVDLNQAAEATIMLKMLWERISMPEIYIDIANNVLAGIQSMSDNGVVTDLELLVNEVKSVSKYVWDLIESTGQPSAYHKFQVFHYSYGLNKPKGRVTYINRDDCRIKEVDVPTSEENFNSYKDWIAQMTDYWVTQKEPERESLIAFNPKTFRFSKRTMEIEWSRYLTLIYGFVSPQEYRDFVEKPIGSFNRVFARCVDPSKKMTPGNLEVIKEAKKILPNWDDYVDKAKAANVPLEEVEVENE